MKKNLIPIVVAGAELGLVISAVSLAVLTIWPWAFLCLGIAIWIELGS